MNPQLEPLSPPGPVHARSRPPCLRRRPIGRRPDVLAQLSHELRNSLGTIRSAVRLLATGGTAAQEAAGEVVIRQVQQMTRLIDDLLDVSRISNGRLQLRLDRRDLRAVVASAMQATEHVMRRNSHRVRICLPEAPVWIEGDEARLEQVFVNLLTNAAKYTPPGGDISLVLVQEDGEAVVTVRDNGVGMAPELLPRVFDLYVQADPSSSNDGLGLGLPLVRSLVERHRGCVTAASRGIGMGSEFTVRLPAEVRLGNPAESLVAVQQHTL